MKKLAIFAVIAILAVAVLFLFYDKNSKEIRVTNFEECKAAGYPIAESYPEQCISPFGTFIRVIPEEEASERTISLFYYNPSKDTDSSGNISCSRRGLVSVERKIPVSMTPIQDAVRLLLEGNLTEEERNAGLTTEFPLPGVELKSASLKDGVLVLEFSDPNNRTGGGSCRTGILWFQIETTAKQFQNVESVKFIPEELFQP